MEAEALPKDGTRSFLFTTVVMKLLPDSAKSQVMQAAVQKLFKLSVYYTSDSRYSYATSCNRIPEKWEYDSLVMEIYCFSYQIKEIHYWVLIVLFQTTTFFAFQN
jgi:hypothetical protein